jgi:hypothetical protein
MKILSLSMLSVLAAVGLALWEIYFFWASGHGALGPLDGSVGFFSEQRTGINLAWLVMAYLSFQLISIPFSSAGSAGRFIGAIDAMASLLPLMVVVIVLFGQHDLLQTSERWETAIILFCVSIVDLIGGYIFNIALSRRTVDIAR